MKKSQRKKSPDNFLGAMIGFLSAMYFVDNVEIINRVASRTQFGLIEFGIPTWLAEFLIFAAVVLPGYLLGERIQKNARKWFSSDCEARQTSVGEIACGFAGFLLGIWIMNERGYFDDPTQFPGATKLLTDWLIFVTPVIAGALSGGYLQRMIRRYKSG